jgi:hypothetical protein
VQGNGRTEEAAIEDWLARARELACNRPPPLRMPYEPSELFAELERQLTEEAERQEGWCMFTDPTTDIKVWMPC